MQPHHHPRWVRIRKETWKRRDAATATVVIIGGNRCTPAASRQAEERRPQKGTSAKMPIRIAFRRLISWIWFRHCRLVAMVGACWRRQWPSLPMPGVGRKSKQLV